MVMKPHDGFLLEQVVFIYVQTLDAYYVRALVVYHPLELWLQVFGLFLSYY